MQVALLIRITPIKKLTMAAWSSLTTQRAPPIIPVCLI